MDDKILKVLDKIQEAQKLKNYWIVPESTARFLSILVSCTNANKVLEIGTSIGYSGIYFAEALRERNGKLYTVESHVGRFEQAENNFKEAGLSDYIVQINGHAPEIFGDLNEKFDLIFLDATKMEYKSYIEGVLPKLKTGGLIVADNCESHKDAMEDFFTYVENSPNLKGQLLSFDNGIYLILKSGDSD